MLSNKPYLIRAFYEWIVDSSCTPFIVINAAFPRVKVPQQHIDENGQITLNVSSDAVRDLKMGNDFVEFRASFSGVVHFITAPIKAVLAIYAQENGQGMFFDFEEDEGIADSDWEGTEVVQPEAETVNTANSSQDKKRPSYLKLVE